MTVEELQVIVTARTRGLEQQMQGLTRQLQGVQRQTNTMSNNMARTFTNLKRTLLALGIGKAIKSMFDLSRNYEASVQQVNRMFKENASAIESWIEKNALTFGMARADAMNYARVYGNLVRGFEKDTAKMASYTTELLEATTVVASSTGRTVKDVSERIRSGILGNTEAIEDIGVYAQVAMLKTSKAFKELANGRTWDQLTFQEQQQIRVMSILEQVNDQFGASVQQNTNYQLMKLTANLKNIGLNLGNAFMPIVSVVLPVLNSMALALANVTNRIAAFMNTLFGTNFNTGTGDVQQVATGANDAANGYSDMADAADDAGDSAKKAGKAAKNAIMGFDEINSLAKDSGSGDSGSGSGETGTSDTGVATSTVMSQAAESFADKIKSTMDYLKGLFQQGFEIGLGDGWQAQVDDINNSIEGIKTSLKDIFTDSEVIQSAKGLAESIALNLGKVSGAAVSIGTTVAQNLLGGIDKYLQQNSQFIKDRLIGIMDAKAEIANLAGDFAVTFADIFSVFGNEDAQQITANIMGISYNASLGIEEIFSKLGRDILECITKPIEENKGKIKLALENTLKPIESITGTLSKSVTDFFTDFISMYDTYIEPSFTRFKDGISEVFGSLLDAYNEYIAPALMDIATRFSELYEDNIKPMVEKMNETIGKAFEMISTLWQNILAPIISQLIDVLAPLVQAAIENIWLAVEKAIIYVSDMLNSLFEILGGVLDFLTGVFSGDWDKAWEGIKEVVSGIGNAIETLICDGLGGIVSYLGEYFINSWEGAKEGICNLFSPLAEWFDTNVIQPVGKFFTDLWDDMTKAASKCWDDICKAWNSASEWFNTNIIEPIKTKFEEWKTSISTLATEAWNAVVSAWQSAVNWFSNTIIEPIKTKFTEWKTSISTLATQAWAGVKNAWNSAVTWFSNTIVTPIETKFNNTWNNIKQKGIDAFNGIKNGVKNAVNGIIDHINGLIRKINSIGFDMPDALGGGRVGFSIPTIPKLARGGVVDGATFMGNYIAGEAGKEMIVPLENTSFTDKIASAMGQAVMNAMAVMLNGNSNIGGNGQNVFLEMEGTVFARSITPYIIKEMRRLSIDI